MSHVPRGHCSQATTLHGLTHGRKIDALGAPAARWKVYTAFRIYVRGVAEGVGRAFAHASARAHARFKHGCGTCPARPKAPSLPRQSTRLARS